MTPLPLTFLLALAMADADSASAPPPVPVATESDSTFVDLRGVRSLGTTEVVGRRGHLERMGALGKAIAPTQVLTEKSLQRKNADNLAQALDGEPGVNSATGCSMCAMRRVQINGLGGEHTTVLVDGLPLHSTVSSYYGMDALTSAGLARIEIARGPGASLLAPEAIAGTVDIRLRNPTGPSLSTDLAIGTDDWRRLSIVGTNRSADGRLGLLAAAQFSGQGQLDADDNGVNESPALDNASGFARIDGVVGEAVSWDVRVLRSNSEIFGGPMVDGRFGAVTTSPDDLGFEGGDVRERWTGSPLATMEWIQTRRDELAGGVVLERLGTWQLRGAVARQIQDSEYEGGDYWAEDLTHVIDLRWTGAVGDHTLTAGANLKRETLDSKSRVFYDENGLTPDSFEAWFGGVYGQGVLALGHDRDLSLAVRADKAQVDWIFQGSEPEVEEIVVSPRAHLRWEFLEGLTGRLSGGLGWRAPLTFFESDHGLVEDGFDVDIEQIERAWGAGAVLSWDRPRWSVSGGVFGTLLEGLAYVHTEDVERPTLRSYPDALPFLTWDAQASAVPWSWLSVGTGIEHTVAPDRFKALSTLVGVETRVHARADVEKGPVTVGATLTWTAPRDLEAYGYGDRFNVFDDADGDREVDDGELGDPKSTRADAFVLLDLQATWKTTTATELYCGVQNVLDQSQAGELGESPLFWDAEGDFDVGHIWGPLRGRQVYGGLRVTL